MTVPRFAVVGHPNKGKSSIVATLAEDETVAISPLPGTTTRNHRYPMRVNGEVIYELIDTPGFQRARRALEWMKSRSMSASDRPAVVRRFVENHRLSGEFPDECELLEPLIHGAGILYVVDGSRPFASEFEAEMEILRWTGQPSLALINRIGAADHTEQWRDGLSQYFRIVREFNPMTADIHKRLELLNAFGQMREGWRNPLRLAVRELTLEYERRRRAAAGQIAAMTGELLDFQLERKLPADSDINAEKIRLLDRFRKEIIEKEKNCRQRVEKIFHYRRLEFEEDTLPVAESDLFSEETWSMFGLSRQELMLTAMAAGAAAGAGIDAIAGGSTLLLGAGAGAVFGATTAWFTFDKLAETRILGTPLGGDLLRVGPVKNLNFAYVLVGRALCHLTAVDERTHAQREALQSLNADFSTGLVNLERRKRARYEACFRSLRKNPDGSAIDRLSGLILEAMAET